ncbi:hypothetical protein AURDEDRAFT_150073 [Auricularia subglabra TFB-10046 SS5]|nr:hypothetical protein AURDEDRAFT_150073 [Auricularia subglabra TFB-10046 SS5]
MLHDVAKQHMMNTALTWSFTQGPGAVPTGVRAQSHCVAIRPVAVRRRDRLGGARIVSAVHVRSRDEVLRRVRLSIHDLRSKAKELFLPSHRRNPSSISVLPATTHTPESSAESNGYFEHPEPETACTSMTEAERPSGPSVLHEILDAVLDSHPEIALAVGDWNVIDRYVEVHNELPEADCSKSLDIVHTSHHGCVAYLLDVAPPVHPTHSMRFESFVTPPAELDALHSTLLRPHLDRLRNSILKLEAQHFQLQENH